ncbi:hypothetical protein BDZ45DRAFT_83724 [Acephala macrosclerotiorum]|nr:hypothetical protein BDZ45DRAFT_83724 [Acephala macrosclerotiorum]
MVQISAYNLDCAPAFCVFLPFFFSNLAQYDYNLHIQPQPNQASFQSNSSYISHTTHFNSHISYQGFESLIATMPRRRQHPPVPLNLQPRTRSVVEALNAALVAPLPANGRPILPAAPPRALQAPPVSPLSNISSIASLPSPTFPADGRPHQHVEYSYRGDNKIISRADWEDPDLQALLREYQVDDKATARKEKLRRLRVGLRGRRARRAAWKKRGGQDRLRHRGKFVASWEWSVARMMALPVVEAAAFVPAAQFAGLGLLRLE